MRNDMRIKYPLWQMGFIVLLMLVVYFRDLTKGMDIQENNWYTPMSIGVLTVIVITQLSQSEIGK